MIEPPLIFGDRKTIKVTFRSILIS